MIKKCKIITSVPPFCNAAYQGECNFCQKKRAAGGTHYALTCPQGEYGTTHYLMGGIAQESYVNSRLLSTGNLKINLNFR